MLKKSLMFVLFFTGIVEGATRAPTNPKDALYSEARLDLKRKIEKIIRDLPPETPLRLVLGISINDIEKHPGRDSSFYRTKTILHLSNDDVDFEVLRKNDQLLWGDFNDWVSSWALFKKLKGRFCDIYFDWSTFKLFNMTQIRYLNELLRVGGHVYVPEPELAKPTSSEERRRILSRKNVQEENEGSFWEDYKRHDSQKKLKEAFESYGFSVAISRSNEVSDSVFGEIRRNQNYIEHPTPFNVLIATKVKNYDPSERS